MSSAPKLKFASREVVTDVPTPSGPNEFIVKIIATKGNNLHEVEFPDGARILSMMPTKLRKKIWIKRGDFVIAEKLEASEKLQLKVQAEIRHILTPDQVKELKTLPSWPERFKEAPAAAVAHDKRKARASPATMSNGGPADEDGSSTGAERSDEESSGDDDLFQNTNRKRQDVYDDVAQSDDDAEDDEDDSEVKDNV